MKKKIVIFTSSGGGGHITTSKALHAYLQDNYSVQSMYVFRSVLKTIDPIYLITLGYYSGEDTYNYCAAKGWLFALNSMYHVGTRYFRLLSGRARTLIKRHIEKHRPDMIISVAPLINDIILDVAQQCNIPFLLIPTDLDATTFLESINDPDYKQFHVALSFDNPVIKQAFKRAHIPQHYINTTGFPLRQSFFEQKDQSAIKRELSISEGKPVILVLLGFRGSNSMVRFAQELAKLKKPAHIIFCTGTNEAIQQKIEQIPFPTHITRTILGFVKTMPDIMAITDLLITKAGSVSVYEALYMNLPMLLDATATLLLWEKLNHTFIKKNGFGNSITDHALIQPMVEGILASPQLQTAKSNLQKLNKLHGNTQIQLIIEKALSEQPNTK